MLDSISARLVAAGVCSSVLTKERLLPAAELAGLHSEQRALLDLLVLTRASALVGHGVSSFSYLARDLRALRLGAGAATATARLLPHGMFVDAWLRLAPAV